MNYTRPCFGGAALFFPKAASFSLGYADEPNHDRINALLVVW